MRISQRMQGKQSQKLHMSPQVQQSILVLQMNNLELTELLQAEAEKNPFLETGGEEEGVVLPDETQASLNLESEVPPSTDMGAGASSEKASSDGEVDAGDLVTLDDVITRGHLGDATLEAEDEGWREESRSDATEFLSAGSETRATSQIIEEVVAEDETLADYLRMQLVDLSPKAGLREVCMDLVGWIDEDGYLREDDSEICDSLDITQALLDEALQLLRGLNPAGIFGRNLRDCLGLQWQRLPDHDPAQHVLLDHLDLLARGKLDQVSEVCNLNKAELSRALRHLQSLNPRPAAEFTRASVGTQAPEILVRRDGNSWKVSLNDDALPRILVLERDWEEMAKRPMSDADRRFLASNVQSARWLASAAQQRAVTMLRVAQAVVDRQNAFLRHGQRALEPMVLREIAEILDLHESTVSRTVANKLIDTPAGTFALKDLFSAALTGALGADGSTEQNNGASAAGVKARIRALIDDEKPDRVISDDMIVETLKGEGIGVARRTIAKYRESLNIPSSVIRRRANRIHGLLK